MRKYAIVGSLLILGMALAGRVVSMKSWNRSIGPTLAINGPDEGTKSAVRTSERVVENRTQLPNVPIVDEPVAETKVILTSEIRTSDGPPALELPPAVPEPAPPAEPMITPEAPPASSQPPITPAQELPTSSRRKVVEDPPAAIVPKVSQDPLEDVDQFLVRNRKEADAAIQGLNHEAETLRARLAKVEAALARWQDVSNALNQRESGRPAKDEPMPSDLEPIPAGQQGPVVVPPSAAPTSRKQWKQSGSDKPTVKVPVEGPPVAPNISVGPDPAIEPVPTPTPTNLDPPPPTPGTLPGPGTAPAPVTVPPAAPASENAPPPAPIDLPSLPEPGKVAQPAPVPTQPDPVPAPPSTPTPQPETTPTLPPR